MPRSRADGRASAAGLPRHHTLICRFPAGPVNLSHHGSDEQMFGAKQQVLHRGSGRLRSRFANERRVNHG